VFQGANSLWPSDDVANAPYIRGASRILPRMLPAKQRRHS
jgi:hypothetical protein